ncbi:JmjC domain-containing protein [Streptomyces nitrosporeus]|uniref:JmjC domain-containing protein n=1 Tax=Streptomyces nitrosporeus TaxID=28894 RepID=UPI00399F1611
MTALHSAVVARLGGDFLAGAFGRTYRVMPGDTEDVAGVITWGDLNEIVARHRLEPPRLRLSTGGETVPLDTYSVREVTRRRTVWNRLHPAPLHAELAAGASLVVDAIDELHPGVEALATELEAHLRTRVQVNLYASWTSREGFGVHWDDHDVVVVQVDGSKRWKLYGPTRTAPLHRDTTAPEPPPEDPVAEFVLTPGDMLYLPRGWWHSVSASEGERSLHLTCGLSVDTGADLIVWLSEVLRDHEIVRADLPRFRSAKEQMNTASELRDLLVRELSDPNIINQYFTLRDENQRARFRTSLPHVDGLPADPALSVRMLTTRHDLRRNAEGHPVLTAGGETFTFAEAAHPLLWILTDRRPHALGNLASASGLTVEQAAGVAWELVKKQVAAVDGDR